MSRRKENSEGEKMEVKRHSQMCFKIFVLVFYQGLDLKKSLTLNVPWYCDIYYDTE